MSEPLDSVELELEEGWIDARVAAEFPGLRLLSAMVPARHGRSSRELKQRLAYLSSRFHGADAVLMRQRPIPHAYRVFYREVGLDPDATRTPAEEAAFNRLFQGGYKAHDRVSDAILLAVAETGVPMWIVDDERLDGPLGIRPAVAHERLGRDDYAHELPAGRLVVADAEAPVAELFGRLSPFLETSRATARMRLFTIQVEGVPEVHVQEALWLCAGALTA